MLGYPAGGAENVEIGKQMLYLSEADERRVNLDMNTVIDVLEEVHIARKEGRAQMPPKPGLRPVGKAGFVDGYPAFVEGTEYLGIKWLSGYFDNPSKGLPFINGLIILNDIRTGVPICVMSCGYLTALRTGGIHGVGLRRLTKPGDRVVGVVGCGLQARTHLLAAMAACRELTDVCCWDPNPDSARRYADDMKKRFPELNFHTSEKMEEAVSAADVLLICAPLFPDGSGRMIGKGLLKEGVTVAAVNGDSSFLEEALPEFDRVFVDDGQQYPVRKQAGMLSYALTETCDELAELARGNAEGRRGDRERILITTEGIAINDVSAAWVMYQAALEQGIGTQLPL